MWYDLTATKMIQKYLNIYSQIKMQFDGEGKINTVALFQEGRWISSPALAKQMRLQHITLPIRQEASMVLKR
ncbi:hypothetical protein U8527_18195 [Kordia algicida OT-1]|uniref:Uncharacterized protein n=1 Tax=Kordia algicida OT-1 TaxID=391587 RepID=A9DIK9_9FLAO|nr:hypothetical protein [Kordia algicida]EDP97924.1 hypothetical protein KAOT1_11942 [Kordia algicida OT-1]